MAIAEDGRKAWMVIVPDAQLSLAIGRQGQNVRLASRLLGWKIDVKSEQRYANMDNRGYRSLTAVDGVDESLAGRLFAAGVSTAPVLATMDVEQLMTLARLDQDRALALQKAAAAVAPPEEGDGDYDDDADDLDDQVDQVDQDVPESQDGPAADQD